MELCRGEALPFEYHTKKEMIVLGEDFVFLISVQNIDVDWAAPVVPAPG